MGKTTGDVDGCSEDGAGVDSSGPSSHHLSHDLLFEELACSGARLKWWLG